MANILRRPRTFAAGMVSRVPNSPPRLKKLVVWAFQLSTRASVAAGLRPWVRASVWARPLATMDRKAAHVHQEIRAGSAMAKPLAVSLRTPGANSSRRRGGRAPAPAFFQTSGSRAHNRVEKHHARGERPGQSTQA